MSGDITEKDYIAALEKALRDIHDMHSFEWLSMPDQLKQDIKESTLEVADDVLKLRWRLPKPRPAWAIQDEDNPDWP